jgi:hypothetical protein
MQSLPRRSSTRATLMPPPPGSLRAHSHLSLRVSTTRSTAVETSTAGLSLTVTMSVIVPADSGHAVRRDVSDQDLSGR